MPPVALCYGGGQRPVTHRTHPAGSAEAMPPTAAAQLQYAVKPERPVSWRSTPTMNPSLARCRACKPVQRATQWVSARYGTREGGTRRRLPFGGPPAVRASFRLPPSRRPSDPIGGPRTPTGARGPLFIFRKIHLYGKTKKSTHGRTTPTPTPARPRHRRRGTTAPACPETRRRRCSRRGVG